MKVRFSNICQVKIERGTQFGRVLIAITFIWFNRVALGRERVKLDFSNVILKKWVYPHLFKGSPKWITADFAEIFRRINVESRFWKYFPAKLYGTFLNKKEIYSLPLFDLIYSAGKTHKTSNYSQWSRLTVHTNLAYHSYHRNCISSVKRSQILKARIIIGRSLKIEDFPQPLAFEWTRELVSSIINALTLLNQFKSYHHQWHQPAKVSNTIIFDRNMEQFRRFSNQWKNWIWWNKSSDSRQICTSRKITSTISWEPFGNCIFSGPRSIGENKKYEGFDCWLLAKQF